MPITLAQCAAEVRGVYPKCSDTEALRLVRKSYQDLCDEFAIDTLETTISLVAGQRRYVIDASWDTFRSVVYRPTSDPLDAKEILSLDGLDGRDDKGTLWRYVEASEPCEAILDGNELILVPPSASATPLGVDQYPRLDVEVTMAATTAAHAALPTTIRRADPIVTRALVLWAKEHDEEKLGVRQASYQDEIERFQMYARKRNLRQRDQSYPESYTVGII